MPNIIIRRATPDDAEAFQRIFDQPRALWGTLQIPFASVEMRRKRLTDAGEGTYPLVAEVDGEVVGHLNLHAVQSSSPRRRHAGALGMAVRDDWHGRGVGTALMRACVDLADNWLNLHRLELDVFVDNEPAIRLYKKFGFVTEGRLVDYAFRDGQYVDVFMMGRIRPGDTVGGR
jgi:putative acetyltransferase